MPPSGISLGEDSTRQFQADLRNGDSLASEMVAFANCEGGTIFVGAVDVHYLVGPEKWVFLAIGDLSRRAGPLVFGDMLAFCFY